MGRPSTGSSQVRRVEPSARMTPRTTTEPSGDAFAPGASKATVPLAASTEARPVAVGSRSGPPAGMVCRRGGGRAGGIGVAAGGQDQQRDAEEDGQAGGMAGSVSHTP